MSGTIEADLPCGNSQRDGSIAIDRETITRTTRDCSRVIFFLLVMNDWQLGHLQHVVFPSNKLWLQCLSHSWSLGTSMPADGDIIWE